MATMNWKTTLSGILGAMGTSLGATGVLPPPWGIVAQLLGALGIALLGTAAADRTKPPPSGPSLLK